MGYATSVTKEYKDTHADVVTTWAYCWRCGKKIPYTHTYEQEKGVHKHCESHHYWDDVPMLILQPTEDKKHLQLRWKMSN